ncbi:MAG: hypothetical protein K6G20_05135 [Ruminococcus sp.]|nr:hypothetical protein [Ruminococcus sp.]
MKKFNLKNFVSASLVALSLCPAIASFNSAAPVYAAGNFISDTDNNGAINIDENQISVICLDSHPTTTLLDSKINNGVISSIGDITNFPALQMEKVTINVQGNNINETVKDKLQDVKFSLTSTTDGISKTKDYSPIVIKRSNTSYDLVYNDVKILGSSVTFSTSKLPDIDGLNCDIEVETIDDSDFKYISVITPNGEDLYIRIKNNQNVSLNNIKKWAKRICMYANSLSQMTGVKLGTLYMNFNDPKACPYSSNSTVNGYCTKLGFVGISNSSTQTVLERMKLDKNEIVWVILHEVGHSYGIQSESSKFWYNFVPIYNKDHSNYQDDDFFTNLRGLTAIQNCDNLRNTDIYINNNGTARTAKYNKILSAIQVSPPSSEYIYYTFAKKVSNIAYIMWESNVYGWEKLETYFAAQTDYNYESDENRAAARAINDFLGTSYPVNDNNMTYARMTNNLRKLYKLTSGNGAFNQKGFKHFLSSCFGKSFIRELYAYIDARS